MKLLVPALAFAFGLSVVGVANAYPTGIGTHTQASGSGVNTTGGANGLGGSNGLGSGSGSPTGSGSAPVGAVPEPATWALMLVGVAALGASLRGRRAAADRA